MRCWSVWTKRLHPTWHETPFPVAGVAALRRRRAHAAPQFRAELKHVSDKITRVKDDPSGLRIVSESLPEHWTVQDAGQQWQVPANWLRDDLAAKEIDYARIEARLTAMSESVFVPPVAKEDGARGRMKAILDRDEFRPRENTWLEEWKAKIWRAIGDFLRKIFGGVARIPDVSDTFFRVLLIALAAFGIAFLARRLLFRPQEDLSYGLGGAPASPSRNTWIDFSRRASEAAAAGDYREAIRLAYWAGIYRLEELGQWRAERTRTHREYLRLLPKESSRFAPLAALTERFELSWYAGQPPTAAEFEVVAHQLEELGCPLPLNPATARS